MAQKENGLAFRQLPSTYASPDTYLFQKCGSKRMPGIKMKAGNVMRLKIPNAKRKPRIKLDGIEDRLCYYHQHLARPLRSVVLPSR